MGSHTHFATHNHHIMYVRVCVCVCVCVCVRTYLLKVLDGVLVWDEASLWRRRGSAAVSGGSGEAVDETPTVVVALQSVATAGQKYTHTRQGNAHRDMPYLNMYVHKHTNQLLATYVRTYAW